MRWKGFPIEEYLSGRLARQLISNCTIVSAVGMRLQMLDKLIRDLGFVPYSTLAGVEWKGDGGFVFFPCSKVKCCYITNSPDLINGNLFQFDEGWMQTEKELSLEHLC